MRATAIFFVFFLLFTSASIAVPIPLFPGNMISTLFGIPASEYMSYLEALTNGLTYSFITWIVFFLLDKKIEKSLSMDSKRMTR
jgi:mannitol-specific phosphotransferase system IIBC component